MKNRVRERSFGELIEQVIISNIRLTWFEHAKQKEHAKKSPDFEKIAEWDRASRAVNERRAEGRQAIDDMLAEVIQDGAYVPDREYRNFRKQ